MSTAALRRPGAALAAAALAALALAAPGAHAQSRRTPWATVNSCDPANNPGSIGVRVFVPNRRDAAQWIRIRIQFFDGTRHAWRVVRSGGEGGFSKLSNGGGRVFGGTTFVFTPPSAGRQLKLRGLVDIEWRRGRRVVSHVQVTTHAGHADAGDPLLRTSIATCVIAR